jgi:prolipoprotein diacylglyceryltransferase
MAWIISIIFIIAGVVVVVYQLIRNRRENASKKRV